MTEQAEKTFPNLTDFADVTLLNDEGKSVKLTDFLGKRVLIFMFPKADTPGCTTQACGFRDAFPKITDAGATVIGMSADTPKALAAWKKKQNLPYTLISDPEHKVIDRFHSYGERSFMGKSYMGIIRSHYVFDTEGKLIDAQNGIKPQDSIDKGVAALTKA